MLNKKRTHYIMISKYLMFIPLVSLLIFFSNCTKEAEQLPSSTDSTFVATSVSKQQKTKADAVVNGNGQIYDIVKEMPVFPGGSDAMQSFIMKNVTYPDSVVEKQIQGRVIVQFIINEDGSVSDAVVIRSVDPLLDNEALRIIKLMPKWTPGKIDGKPVKVRNVIPIVFNLS